MKRMIFFVLLAATCRAEDHAIKVGVATMLSGEFSALGQNLVRTCETYRSHLLRHPVQFVYEDGKVGSMDGLRAYQKLIRVDNVDMLIGGTSSNGTIAAKDLINSARIPLITPLTGGTNIDKAGPFVFRIGNSDILNGKQQAESFLQRGKRKIALLAEETEYTQDIAESFREHFLNNGGQIEYDESFLPGRSDFRTEISVIIRKNVDAVFVPTQTGVALGIFARQLEEQSGKKKMEIATSFVAAVNPDALKAGGDAIKGVHFMAPLYDRKSSSYTQFLDLYRLDHGRDPEIHFHTAGTVDALNLLQDYLDTHYRFNRDEFAAFLLHRVQNYKGLMGTFSFDKDGNADSGFQEQVIDH